MIPEQRFPYEHTRSNGWIGAKVIGSGTVRRFVNAYFGLEPWDAFFEVDYLDRLLLTPGHRPSNVILTKGHSNAE